MYIGAHRSIGLGFPCSRLCTLNVERIWRWRNVVGWSGSWIVSGGWMMLALYSGDWVGSMPEFSVILPRNMCSLG